MKHTDLRSAVALLEQWEALDRQQLAIRKDPAKDIFVRFQAEPWQAAMMLRLRREDVLAKIRGDMHDLALRLYAMGVWSDMKPSDPEPPVRLPVAETPDEEEEIEAVEVEAATMPEPVA